MWIDRALIALVVAAACQTSQPDSTPSPGSSAASTTYTRGTPDTIRSDTSASPSSEGVSLTLDRATYAAGATVNLRIRSATRDTLGFNQCSSRVVERRSGSSWAAHPEPGRMCTMELRLLMPGETQSVTTDLPADLQRGTYRIVVNFSRQSSANPGTVRAVSSPFTVN